MNKIIIVIALLISSISTQAQFIHSIEFNNGFSISSVTANRYSGIEKYFIGLSTAINAKYLNHKYWNLSSQLGYMEAGQKTEQEGVNFSTNERTTNYNIFYFNLISFNTMLEIKYPNKRITPSLKFGPRIDYTYIDISVYDNLNTVNYGFALGAGLNYQFKGHFNLHIDYIYNWFAKDIVSAPNNSGVHPHTAIYNPAISIRRNMSVMLGFGYKF